MFTVSATIPSLTNKRKKAPPGKLNSGKQKNMKHTVCYGKRTALAITTWV